LLLMLCCHTEGEPFAASPLGDHRMTTNTTKGVIEVMDESYHTSAPCARL
jgi:hypothetical protein